eukprot:363446-Chlamydomonas_euryale.AAC.1
MPPASALRSTRRRIGAEQSVSAWRGRQEARRGAAGYFSRALARDPAPSEAFEQHCIAPASAAAARPACHRNPSPLPPPLLLPLPLPELSVRAL